MMPVVSWYETGKQVGGVDTNNLRRGQVLQFVHDPARGMCAVILERNVRLVVMPISSITVEPSK